MIITSKGKFGLLGRYITRWLRTSTPPRSPMAEMKNMCMRMKNKMTIRPCQVTISPFQDHQVKPLDTMLLKVNLCCIRQCLARLCTEQCCRRYFQAQDVGVVPNSLQDIGRASDGAERRPVTGGLGRSVELLSVFSLVIVRESKAINCEILKQERLL